MLHIARYIYDYSMQEKKQILCKYAPVAVVCMAAMLTHSQLLPWYILFPFIAILTGALAITFQQLLLNPPDIEGTKLLSSLCIVTFTSDALNHLFLVMPGWSFDSSHAFSPDSPADIA